MAEEEKKELKVIIKELNIQTIAGEEYESYCGIRKELFRFVFEQIYNADEKKLALFRRTLCIRRTKIIKPANRYNCTITRRNMA